MNKRLQLSSLILKKAKELGADLAGITGVEELKDCPSFTVASKIPHAEEVGPTECKLDLKTGEVAWPEEGKGVIVIALSHPEDKPELDWWLGKKSPPGNKILINVINELSTWLESKYQIKTYHMPYHIENGGIFLKDAAVMAGLGCIGRNNLLITPEYGPRVRLRAMVTNMKLISTGPISFDPCSDCKGYCLDQCPTGAFDKIIYQKEEVGQKILPGRIGNYSRLKCNKQMKAEIDLQNENEIVFSESDGEMYHPVKHCRNCEFSCPIGQ
ncbi:MAG: epoxyqueuosine reductase [Elusimicrobiota bacterium]